MRLIRTIIREIRFRKAPFAFCIVAVLVAAASVSSSRAMLLAHELRTAQLLQAKERQLETRLRAMKEGMRQAMLKLTFNLVILPGKQQIREWHANGFGSETMPDEYVHRLANSGIVSVRHFLPSLQQKILWPETKRKIILVGTRGEVPNLHKNPVKPLVQPVPDGSIVLGYELHRSLGLKPGDQVQLLGRTFTLHRCHEQRGSKDDATAWIPLRAAQELLQLPGRVNAILALECLCVGMENVARVRRDITDILPGTQVLEQGTKALARAEARLNLGSMAKAALADEKRARLKLCLEYERYAAGAVSAILLACLVWLVVLFWLNTLERNQEIGIWRALGLRSPGLLVLILGRALAAAVPGALAGVFLGSRSGRYLAAFIDPGAGIMAETVAMPLLEMSGIVLVCILLTILSSWFPALIAIGKDPVEILRSE